MSKSDGMMVSIVQYAIDQLRLAQEVPNSVQILKKMQVCRANQPANDDII